MADAAPNFAGKPPFRAGFRRRERAPVTPTDSSAVLFDDSLQFRAFFLTQDRRAKLQRRHPFGPRPLS
jgi:hypothetical protein